MQNDMLKNNIAPWQEKGRWYHASITSDGTNWVLNNNESDPIFTTMSARYLQLGSLENRIIDVRPIFRKPYTIGTTMQLYTTGIFSIQYSGGTVSIYCPLTSAIIGTVDLYCYIV